jgi:hypothetical protein
MDLVESLAEAVARFEGYYRQGSRAQRNNNPGNLRERPPGDRRGPKWPQYPKDAGGYVIFPSAEVGWAELRKRIEASIGAGDSLESFLAVYAPPAENPTASYVRTVAGWLGLDPSRPLRDYLAAGGVPAEPVVPLPPVGGAEAGGADLVLVGAVLVALVSAVFLVLS